MSTTYTLSRDLSTLLGCRRTLNRTEVLIAIAAYASRRGLLSDDRQSISPDSALSVFTGDTDPVYLKDLFLTLRGHVAPVKVDATPALATKA
jgi:hypothetical protein